MKELAFKVSLDETNLILEGLGHLPFARVYALVEKVQQQANEQLRGGPEAVATPAASFAATESSAAANGGSNGR